MMERSLLGLTFSELEARLAEAGVKTLHADALFRFLHRRARAKTSEHELPSPLRAWLAGVGELEFSGSNAEVVGHTQSDDGKTHKYLLRLADGQEVETVTMGYPGRCTACLSTQAGCAMGCVFCATGQMGFVRHLQSEEIVTQAHLADQMLREVGESLRNVVLMGMGEPLHNYDAVMNALDIVCDSRGMGVAASHVTINTVGVVPGILRLAQENRPYRLGVSLHAATDAGREALVPVNRRWPLGELMNACKTYNQRTGRRILFAWTLIAFVNDELDQADQLVALLDGVNAHVNLIRLNETAGYTGREPLEERANAFRARLQQGGVPCTIRQRRGIDVAAGCGQLTAPRRLIKGPRRIPSLVP